MIVRAVKQLIPEALHIGEEESQSCGLLVYLIGYFQDILCKQAKKCDVFMKTVLTSSSIAKWSGRHLVKWPAFN